MHRGKAILTVIARRHFIVHQYITVHGIHCEKYHDYVNISNTCLHFKLSGLFIRQSDAHNV